MTMGRLPNFLYVGTCKAGSTWLYDVLAWHPDVFMAPGKGLYFFTTHYERGLDWYRAHFDAAGDERIAGEISHTYMYEEKVCERIAAMGEDVKLMVCLREPVERAFSDYLDGVKNGHVRGTFEETLGRDPVFVDRSRYARYLAPYVSRFGRERLHVGVFDELVEDPDEFARKVFAFLGVEELELAARQREKMMPAGAPRSRFLARAAKRASHAARAVGLRGLRGRVKRSRWVRDLLYRAYAPQERPSMSPATRERLRGEFREEVERLDALLGTDFVARWGYGSLAPAGR